LPRAGQRLSFKRRVGFSERGMGRAARDYATGDGSLALEEESKIHPNDVKELPCGECFVIAGGKYQRVLVKQVTAPQTARQSIPPTIATPLFLPIDRPRTPIAIPDAPQDTPSLTEPPPAPGATYADEADEP
jgi:hypothetical protein